MARACIFDREVVQAKFFLHLQEFGLFSIFQCNPDKTVRYLYVVADLFHWYVAQFFAFLVGDAVDQHVDLQCGWRECMSLQHGAVTRACGVN